MTSNIPDLGNIPGCGCHTFNGMMYKCITHIEPRKQHVYRTPMDVLRQTQINILDELDDILMDGFLDSIPTLSDCGTLVTYPDGFTYERIPATINDKKLMYSLLKAGRLGNALQSYYTLSDWLASNPKNAKTYWGIRTNDTSMDKRMRLNVQRIEVEKLYTDWFPDGTGGNISPMIDMHCTCKLQLWDAPHGYELQYITMWDFVDPWRGSFEKYGQHATGIKAKAILRHYLNENSYNDLQDLLAMYPGHVVEMSSCDICIGTKEHRNTIIWEVRNY